MEVISVDDFDDLVGCSQSDDADWNGERADDQEDGDGPLWSENGLPCWKLLLREFRVLELVVHGVPESGEDRRFSTAQQG